MYFVKKKTKDVIKFFLIVLFFRIIIEGLPLTTNYKLWVINFHVNPFIRSLEFLLGMLLVPCYNFVKLNVNTKTKHIIFSIIELFSIILIITFCYYTHYIRAIYVVLWCLFIFIFSFNSGIISYFLSSKIFKLFGPIQMSFYMLHQVVIKLFLKYGENMISEIFLQSMIIFIITCIVSFLYTNYLDKKILSEINHIIN